MSDTAIQPPETNHAPRGVSVLILTLNEELNIAACLDTLAFSDDIVVLDSFSSDRTLDIVRQYPNTRIIQRKFDTWSRHSNWALDNIKFKYSWVYYSDADERIPPDLREEILAKTADQSRPHVAYRLRYQNMFMNRWLRHGGMYPVWIIRLFRPEKIRYEDREVNAHPVVDGPLGDLDGHFIHYSFNKGLRPWFSKHNSYSDMEAKEAARIVRGSVREHLRKLRSPVPAVKRRAAKDLSFFMPLRAAVRFGYMYFFRLGMLDGRAGFHYAAMISMYEYWIEVKIREIDRRWSAQTDTRARALISRHDAGAGAAGTTHPVSVLILTKDEQVNIADCLDCFAFSDDVIVYDSFSSDRTLEIARRYPNVRVIQRRFDNWAAHQNWGVQNIPFKHPWVLYVDADERVPAELAREVCNMADPNRPEAALRVRRKDMFRGRWLRHAQLYPTWIIRMFRPAKIRYERLVNPVAVVDGAVGELQEHLIHYPFSKGIFHWFERHNSYSSFETAELLNGADTTRLRLRDLFSGDPIAKRVALKKLFYRLPLRAFMRFLYLYIVRRGILDGPQGFHYAVMMAIYEYWIELKVRERSADWAGVLDAEAARLLGRPGDPQGKPA